MHSPSHLAWIPATALLGFVVSFVFGDRIPLPVDIYYSVYFAIVLGFFAVYTRRTRLDLRAVLSRRIWWGVVLGVLGGLVLMGGVLARPETEKLAGGILWWALFWRGLVYGTVDGLLLLAFPWLVAWRALGAEEGGVGRRLAATAVAWVAVLVVTTAYHLGYGDFRSRKVLQPNVGAAIGIVPTLLTANPAASSISHVFLHLTAVVHSPETDLFLPPHREGGPDAGE